MKKALKTIPRLFRVFSFFKSELTLVCKIDNIGDYILFRNFLEDLKKSQVNGGRKIFLIGNIAWKEIFEKYDVDYVDKVFWINIKKLQESKFYRFCKLIYLNTFNIHTIIQPTYSRSLLIDYLLLPLKAKYKYSPVGDDLNHIPDLKVQNDLQYSNLVQIDEGIEFEFNRNKGFFVSLDPIFNRVVLKLPYEKKKKLNNIICFFIGASSKNRQLSFTNLTRIVNALVLKGNYQILILGGLAEYSLGVNLSKISDNVINLCGKLSLTQTINEIGNSLATITMDSSGFHFAMATGGKKVFCYSNGNHAFRFVPYPKNFKNQIIFYPPIIEKMIKQNEELVFRSFSKGSLIQIDSIDIDKSIRTILRELKV